MKNIEIFDNNYLSSEDISLLSKEDIAYVAAANWSNNPPPEMYPSHVFRLELDENLRVIGIEMLRSRKAVCSKKAYLWECIVDVHDVIQYPYCENFMKITKRSGEKTFTLHRDEEYPVLLNLVDRTRSFRFPEDSKEYSPILIDDDGHRYYYSAYSDISANRLKIPFNGLEHLNVKDIKKRCVFKDGFKSEEEEKSTND